MNQVDRHLPTKITVIVGTMWKILANVYCLSTKSNNLVDYLIYLCDVCAWYKAAH